MNIIWFKRDLRIYDNKALLEASKSNDDIMALYIIEPELWQQDDMSQRHYLFLQECLDSLDKQLQTIGLKLTIRVGNSIDIFNDLIQNHNLKNVYAHQETWNMWTYKRDIAVTKLFKQNNINFNQYQNNGVVRVLDNRDGWANLWYQEMSKQVTEPHACHKSYIIDSDEIPTDKDLGLKDDYCLYRQIGGRGKALTELNRFLYKDGEFYTKEMSSPLTAEKSCSRISPYLAFGCLSIREVFHAAEKRVEEIKQMPRGTKGGWPSAMRSFLGRLRWHCHFIQKLEDQPVIEFDNLHPMFNSLDRTNDDKLFNAWASGNTGYPMIDACMRSLIATGWINFRMRAMLMSFASFHLWLDWRKTSKYLARMFTDYEPGIHYSQAQMQSGTTGINAIRVYNPVKQSQDQDPDGVFIKKWIPELRDMPDMYIHTPWLFEHKLNGYPLPIVDEKNARKAATDKIYAIKKEYGFKDAAGQIVKKHASRKKPNVAKKVKSNPNQLEFKF